MAKPFGFTSVDDICINTLRFLAVDAVEAASSGHPGMPMGDAPMAYVLWSRFLRHNPGNPAWHGRDRFVLSAGHGSMLLYALLHLTGYDLPLEEIKRFRQWGSRTPGHPEYDPRMGVETTTGPLGQGFATGVGMAVAARHLSARFDRPGYPLFGYRVYSIVSDGDLMEGVTNEAASLAGHLGLGNVIYLYSDNRITIEGSTGLSFTEDVALRFASLGWHVQKAGGADLEGMAAAIRAAKDETRRPSLIIARTNIGFGSPGKQDTPEAHGAPLGPDEARLAKERLGWPLKPDFHVPAEALAEFRKAVKNGALFEEEWQGLLKGFQADHPDLAPGLKEALSGALSKEWVKDVPVFSGADGAVATRSASGKVLNAIAKKAPLLMGGSADLAPSTNTALKGMGEFHLDNSGRNMRFGVREHAMGAILNGMALSRLIIPYGATFLVFSDYMRPPIRLAAMMGLKVIYVFTHDSIGLGEDGPTHQPIEHLAGLRAVPGLTVIRPADANETAEAWKAAVMREKGPVALVLTRQAVPVLDRGRLAPARLLHRGAYVLADPPEGAPEVIIIATGSEVHLALGVREELSRRSIRARVVSMPSWELFEAEDRAYRESVLPPDVKHRISIEAGSTMGWHRYVGREGDAVGIDSFGASAPYKTLYEKFGLTVEAIAARAARLVEGTDVRSTPG
jgi:transketolase